jgi:hypothetical protein
MSFRVVFLLVFAAATFKVSPSGCAVLLVGYIATARLDQWQAVRGKTKIIEDEMYGWTIDPDDSESEVKGNIARRKLPTHEQIVVARVADLLRRIP